MSKLVHITQVDNCITYYSNYTHKLGLYDKDILFVFVFIIFNVLIFEKSTGVSCVPSK